MNAGQSLLFALLMAFILARTFSPAMADDDHLEARRLMESGEVLPLQSILDRIRSDYPGRVIEVELEKKHDHIIYEIEIVDDGGKVSEIRVNARNGHVISDDEDD